MRTLAFAYPGDIDLPTGGYGYVRRIIEGLRRLNWNVTPIPLGDGFPQADAATRSRALEILRAVPGATPIVIDGLAYGAMAEEAEALAQSHAIIALVHHPLALETGLSAAEQRAFRQSETRSLTVARAIITSSPATARTLASDFAVPADRISVVLPGTDRVAPSTAKPHDGSILRIVSVGSLVPRKGHDVLIGALAELSTLPWRLDIAGGDTFDPEHAELLRRLIAAKDLQDRVTLHGALSVSDLDALYAQAEIFALASRYEGYGMAFAEATVRGLPIVATGSGAVADTIAPGTGLLFEPDDASGLRDGLRRMISDKGFRDTCAARSRDAANSFPTWEMSAQRFAAAIEERTAEVQTTGALT